MLKYVIGPVLTGVAYLAGSIYGASAEQLIRKPPGEVYSALTQAAAGVAPDSVMRFEDGSSVPYRFSYEGEPDRKLIVRLATKGHQAVETELLFTPQEAGAATLVTLRVHADRTVLREDFAGTPKARLGYAPDWLFNLALKAPLRTAAEMIEKGAPVADPMAPMAGGGADNRAGWTDQQKQWAQEWEQYIATKPAVDPDQAAEDYLSGR
jgi:hypothetical protein